MVQVFSESLYDKFIDAKGEPIPLADVVQTSFEGDRLVKKIVTPTVVAKAREHFQCPTLNGAELEDEGGPGTAGSHWESRTFQVKQRIWNRRERLLGRANGRHVWGEYCF